MLIYNASFVFGIIFSYWSHNTDFKVIQFLMIFNFLDWLDFCLANVNLVTSKSSIIILFSFLFVSEWGQEYGEQRGLI